MMRKFKPSVCFRRGLICLLLVLSSGSSLAGKVILRIRATNPDNKPQPVQIKSNLPPRAREKDVLSTGGLQLGYDLENDIYYVHDEIEIGPKGTEIVDVEIDDIWVVPEDELERLQARARAMAEMLDGTRHAALGRSLRKQSTDALDAVRRLQDSAAIAPGIKPVQHIRAYEANIEALERVRKDVGKLENLVLGTGRDPGKLIGTVSQRQQHKRDAVPPKDGYKTAVNRITVHNPSPTEKRTDYYLRRDLPPEVRAQDVIDAGGLDIGIDPETGRTYVYKRGMELDPDQRVVFEVRIRDKWNVNEPRIIMLRELTTDILKRVSATAKYVSMQEDLRGLQEDLEAISEEDKPETLSEEYVAFFRDQAVRLDLIESKLNRIEVALRPIESPSKWGFDIKPPSMKTTWLIIYIVLGFLALVSLLFFLRWYGRNKAERIET